MHESPTDLVGLKAGPYLFRAFGTFSITEKLGCSEPIKSPVLLLCVTRSFDTLFIPAIWQTKGLSLIVESFCYYISTNARHPQKRALIEICPQNQ